MKLPYRALGIFAVAGLFGITVVRAQAPIPILSPLSRTDIKHSGLSGLGCEFRASGKTYSIVTIGGALIKVGNSTHLFPINEDRSLALINFGGTFGNSQYRVTVDQDDKILAAGEEGVLRNATLVIRQGRQISSIAGIWNCGA